MSHIEVIHDSPEWHSLRSKHVGGSEVSALFGCQPDYALSRYALWMVKAGRVEAPEVNSVRAVWGLRLEAAIAEAAAEQEMWQITKGGYITDATTAGLGCTLDWIIDGDEAEDGPGCLEIKNVDWMVHRRTWTDDEPPLHILLQLQHQLAATGYSWGCVAGMIGGNDLRLHRYRARPKLIDDIRRRVRGFWQSIEEGVEPPVDGSDGASAVLRALYPDTIDDAIDMAENNEWAEAAWALNKAAEDRRAANDTYEEAKNRVVALLGPYRRGFGNGWAVNCAVTPANPGREPKPGELIGKRSEVRRYSAKEMAA